MNEYEIPGIEILARGVCIVGGKVLLCRPKKGGYTYLPGGHVEFGETSREALVREMQEETGLTATAGDLLGVVESQFEQHGKKHCEISLVYRMTIEPAPDPAQTVAAREDWISFEWRSLDQLDEANVLPPEIRGYVNPTKGDGK
jgi:8-oxo-dGTP diphosphatase